MVLSEVIVVKSPEDRVAWASLQRYQNVGSVTDLLIGLHALRASQRKNAEKQASQLRYCLIQAREYFSAARAVSLATKPTLLYYSIMSLALAEVLLKQSGDSSLDRAREQHKHHGLLFSDTRSGKVSQNLREAAAALVAKPMMFTHENVPTRMGTFELWHRSARNTPYVGEHRIHLPVGGNSSTYDALVHEEDERMSLVPVKGLSLLECLMCVPDMMDFLRSHGVRSNCVRGSIARDDYETPPRNVLRFTIHPDVGAAEVLDNLIIHPNLVDRIECISFPNGGSVVLKFDPINNEADIQFPPCATSNVKEFRCWLGGPRPLNEFGYIYAAVFIAGNYARYYPDRWVFDVENSTPLALAIEELLTIAEKRVPWLTLSELSRSYHVFDK